MDALFLAGVVMNRLKNISQKVGGSTIGEPNGPQMWGDSSLAAQ